MVSTPASRTASPCCRLRNRRTAEISAQRPKDRPALSGGGGCGPLKLAFRWYDQHAVDAPPVHVDDLEPVALNRNPVTDRWDAVDARHHEPAERLEVAVAL